MAYCRDSRQNNALTDIRSLQKCHETDYTLNILLKLIVTIHSQFINICNLQDHKKKTGLVFHGNKLSCKKKPCKSTVRQ